MGHPQNNSYQYPPPPPQNYNGYGQNYQQNYNTGYNQGYVQQGYYPPQNQMQSIF
jgi:hypothetical protein